MTVRCLHSHSCCTVVHGLWPADPLPQPQDAQGMTHQAPLTANISATISSYSGEKNHDDENDRYTEAQVCFLLKAQLPLVCLSYM